MLYDLETRRLITEEHIALLRTLAQSRPREQRTRRWLSERLISAGERLAPDCRPHHRPARAT